MDTLFERRHVDPSLRVFLQSFVSITLTTFLIWVIVSVFLDWKTTGFLALFASAGLAIGVALSGTLQNFAGGIMLLLLKPFRVGDYITAQSQSGTVKSIQLFNTVINTPDNQTIIIPNGPLSTGIINNYSREATRQVQLTVAFAYGQDYSKVHELLLGLVKADERILQDRDIQIVINDFTINYADVAVRVWTKAGDYWNVFYDLNEKIYKVLSDNGFKLPYQQLDVHLDAENNHTGPETGQ